MVNFAVVSIRNFPSEGSWSYTVLQFKNIVLHSSWHLASYMVYICIFLIKQMYKCLFRLKPAHKTLVVHVNF